MNSKLAIDYLDQDDYMYIKQWLKEKGIKL